MYWVCPNNPTDSKRMFMDDDSTAEVVRNQQQKDYLL